MSNKTFKDLTQNECIEAYKRMVNNSDIRWRSAVLLAANNDFGGAIRDHITSIEELVKAMIIYMDSNGFEFRKVDGMDKILTKSHSLRHFMAYLMFVLNVFIEDIKAFYEKVKMDPTMIKKLNGKTKRGRMQMRKFMGPYLFKMVLKLKAEFKWFEKVELLRQTGTHVDYSDKLITPEDISVKDYKQVLIRLENVRFVGKEFLKTFGYENTYMEKEIEKLKSDFKTKGWYYNMGQALTNPKNRNPFEAITKELISLDIGTDEQLKEQLRDESIFEGIKQRTSKKKKRK